MGKVKSLTIDLPEEMYQEIVDNAAIGMGFREKTQVRTEQNQVVTVDEKRTKEQFVKDTVKAGLIGAYEKGVKTAASKKAVEEASAGLADKLKVLKG